jgi:hypothetical protein
MLNEVDAKRDISDTTVNTKLRGKLVFLLSKELTLGFHAPHAQIKPPYGHQHLAFRLHNISKIFKL